MPVSPNHIARLGLVDRSRLGAEILAAYARVRWLLHRQNPAEAVDSLRRHARRHELSSDAGTDLVVGWRIAHAVNVTLRPLPTDVRCLFRSLTLLTLMERRDIHPKLIIGVRPEPFAAHAWIELHGQPLLAAADPDHERLAEL
jgi:hypothetical protein